LITVTAALSLSHSSSKLSRVLNSASACAVTRGALTLVFGVAFSGVKEDTSAFLTSARWLQMAFISNPHGC
jgi:hypothetical protein